MRGDIINIRQDDILWRFYCKRFVIEGKEIEPPKNLCRYFWTSVGGFKLWLDREVKLRSLWLISLLATVMLFGMVRVMSNTNNIVAAILDVAAAVFWIFSVLVAMFVTMYRVKRVVEARAPWVMYLVVFIFLAVVIIYPATQGTLWSEFTRFFGSLFQWMGRVLIMIVTALVIVLILNTIPHRRLQKLRRAFQAFGALVSAKKNNVCPPVNPPDNFKVGK